MTKRIIPVLAALIALSMPACAADGYILKYPGSYAAFKVVSADGIVIVSDPCAMNEDVTADIVTVSHPHADHSDLSRLMGAYKLFTRTGSSMVAGIGITGLMGFHNRTPQGQDMPSIVFVYSVDGVRIAQLGSQGRPFPDRTLDGMGKVDVLIAQLFDGGEKLSLQEWREIADRVQAKVVIPAHGMQELADRFASMIGATVERIPSGRMALSRKRLDSMNGRRVVLLDNDLKAPSPGEDQ